MPSLLLKWGRKTPLPTGKDAGWAAKSFWTLEEENKRGSLGIT
jgi:hypothetical protein